DALERLENARLLHLHILKNIVHSRPHAGIESFSEPSCDDRAVVPVGARAHPAARRQERRGGAVARETRSRADRSRAGAALRLHHADESRERGDPRARLRARRAARLRVGRHSRRPRRRDSERTERPSIDHSRHQRVRRPVLTKSATTKAAEDTREDTEILISRDHVVNGESVRSPSLRALRRVAFAIVAVAVIVYAQPILLAGIHVYQRALSPVAARVGLRCRFTPTCSRYAEIAIARDGVVRGGWTALKRIARCNPLTPFGTVDEP